MSSSHDAKGGGGGTGGRRRSALEIFREKKNKFKRMRASKEKINGSGNENENETATGSNSVGVGKDKESRDELFFYGDLLKSKKPSSQQRVDTRVNGNTSDNVSGQGKAKKSGSDSKNGPGTGGHQNSFETESTEDSTIADKKMSDSSPKRARDNKKIASSSQNKRSAATSAKTCSTEDKLGTESQPIEVIDLCSSSDETELEADADDKTESNHEEMSIQSECSIPLLPTPSNNGEADSSRVDKKSGSTSSHNGKSSSNNPSKVRSDSLEKELGSSKKSGKPTFSDQSNVQNVSLGRELMDIDVEKGPGSSSNDGKLSSTSIQSTMQTDSLGDTPMDSDKVATSSSSNAKTSSSIQGAMDIDEKIAGSSSSNGDKPSSHVESNILSDASEGKSMGIDEKSRPTSSNSKSSSEVQSTVYRGEPGDINNEDECKSSNFRIIQSNVRGKYLGEKSMDKSTPDTTRIDKEVGSTTDDGKLSSNIQSTVRSESLEGKSMDIEKEAESISAPPQSPVTEGPFVIDISDDDDEDNEIDQHIDPKFASATCWSCRISLNDIDGECQDETAKKGNNLFIHSHPIMQVATCSVCADKAYAVENDAQMIQEMINEKMEKIVDSGQENSDRDEDEDEEEIPELEICSWCADEFRQGENLLFCDNCPRIFCNKCVSLAHGAGTKGDAVVKKLQNPDEDWSCIYCSPTPIINSMRAFLKELVEKSADESTSSESDNAENVSLLLQNLEMHENNLEEAEAMLENAESKRKEMEAEGASKASDLSIEERLGEWYRKWDEIHARSSDAIGIIQDELEKRNIDLREFYAKREGVDLEAIKNTEEEEENVESWKKAADAALAKRDAEWGKLEGASGFEGNEDDIDFEDLIKSGMNEIEDISTKKESVKHIQKLIDEEKESYNKHTVKNFTKALKNEEKFLSGKNAKAKVKKRSDESDKKEETRGSGEYKTRRRKNAPTIRVVSRNTNRLRTQKESRRREEKKRRKSQTNNRNKARGKGVKRQRITPQLVQTDTSNATHSMFGSDVKKVFQDSDCILAPESTENGQKSSNQSKAKITVAASLAKVLKPHQINGVKFMWDQTFSDLIENGSSDTPQYRGCILAHNMGLGKSIQVLTLIHTVLTHPNLLRRYKNPRGPNIKRVLLVVPVNTLANWIAEFSKWEYFPQIKLYDFNAQKSFGGKKNLTIKWEKTGGVLLVGYDSLARCCNKEGKTKEKQEKAFVSTFIRAFLNPGADAIILDEGHLQVKNNLSLISKTLMAISTKRRISLSGTPLQNNLNEYLRMVDWVRPGFLGSMSSVEKKYVTPIMSSLTTDSSLEEKEAGDKMLRELFEKLNPFVQRLDSSVLERDLPHMQQAVLHIRQTRAQAKLYRAFKKYQNKSKTSANNKNFLDMYQKLFPVNNHPGCLLCIRNKATTTQKKSPQEEKHNSSSLVKKDNSLSVSVGGELSDMTKLVIQNLDVEKEKATSTQMDVTMADTATAKDVTTDEPQDALSPKLEAIDYEPPTNEQTQSQRSVEIIIVDDTSDEEDEPDVADTDASMNVLVEGTRNDETLKDGVQEQATMKEQIDDSLDAMNVHASKDEDTIMEKNTDDDNIMKTLEEKVIEEKKDDSGEKATEETKEDSEAEDKWWAKVFRKNPLMGDIENGGKVVLLLQILAHADMIGEKVVVFSQSLPTLDFIESAVQSPDWGSKVPSISTLSPGRIWGCWENGKDYLRIDGSIGAETRGQLINQFNETGTSLVEKEADKTTKLFLISSKAGSVGINLTAANRVVIFDSSWNPVVDLQALYRCYRYGQDKPVYAYRFLTESTMEEKVYSRCVNKTSLAARVIDQKDPRRNFSKQEVSDIMLIDNWVQCDLCDKWRMLPGHLDADTLPDFWCCYMNEHDPERQDCEAEEKDVNFYRHLYNNDDNHDVPTKAQESGPAQDARSEDTTDKQKNTERDVILSTLLKIPVPKSKKKKGDGDALVSKYYFHDSLMAEASAGSGDEVVPAAD